MKTGLVLVSSTGAVVSTVLISRAEGEKSILLILTQPGPSTHNIANEEIEKISSEINSKR